MSKTVYTLNGKVLTNSANDKWLQKKEGFVMNGSNATYNLSGNDVYVSWQGPAYPDGYNGNGKQYKLVNNNADATILNQLMYASVNNSGGPNAISNTAMQVPGTSTGVLANNSVPLQYGNGKFLNVPIDLINAQMTLEEVQAYMANVSITILD